MKDLSDKDLGTLIHTVDGMGAKPEQLAACRRFIKALTEGEAIRVRPSGLLLARKQDNTAQREDLLVLAFEVGEDVEGAQHAFCVMGPEEAKAFHDGLYIVMDKMNKPAEN